MLVDILQRKLNFTLLAMKTRANVQCIQSLTYLIKEENADLLQDMNIQLQNLFDNTYQQLPNKEGLAPRSWIMPDTDMSVLSRFIQK